MELFRYEMVNYASGDDEMGRYFFTTSVVQHKYRVFKKTPKGFWIEYPSFNSVVENKPIREICKWVSDSGRKRFAYPSELEALNGFIFRKKSQARILQSQINNVTSALYKAENMYEQLLKKENDES